MQSSVRAALRRLALLAAGTGTLAGAHAACVDPANPLASPTTGVEMFYDIHLPLRQIQRANDEPFTTAGTSQWLQVPAPVVSVEYGLPTRSGDRYRPLDLAAWGEKEARRPVDEMARIGHTTRAQGLGTVNERSDGRPPFVWPDHIDPVSADRKALGEVGGAVYFYEPDTRGGRRLCRVETWGSRTKVFDASSQKAVPRESPIDVPTSPDQTRNPALAALSRDFVMIGYSNLVRDDKGRLPHVGPICLQYRDDGQVSQVAFESDTGQCEGKALDPKQDASIEFLFDGQGKGYGALLNRPVTWETRQDADGATRWRASVEGKPGDGWQQDWNLNAGGRVVAYANDRTGVNDLHATGAMGMKDDTAYNEYGKGEQSRFLMARNQPERRYAFPAFTPTDLLRKPDTLYQYERVRVTGQSVQVLERFAAGGNQLRARIWMVTATGNVPRQEIFRDGKLVRAIVTDFTTPDEHGKLWVEDLTRYQEQIKVPVKNIYVRVYDYDDQGRESLFAIGWTDYPRSEFFAQQRGGRRQQLEKMSHLLGINSKPATKMPAELTYFFGTPDGQVKWPDWQAFSDEVRQRTPAGRQAVFPDGRNDDHIDQ